MVLRMLQNKTQGIGSLCTEQSMMKNEATQNGKTPSSSSTSNQILYDSIKQGFYEIVTCGASSGNGPCVTINNACTPIISRKTTRRGYQKMKSNITTNTGNNNNNNEGDSPTTVASYQIERMTREWGPSHHVDEDSEEKDQNNNNKANEALNTTNTTIGTSDVDDDNDEDDTNSDKSVVANNENNNKIKTRLFESFVQSAQSAIAYDPVNSGCVSFSLYGSKNNNKAYPQNSDPQADSSPSWICNAIPTPPDITCSAFSMSLKNGKTNLQKRKERHLKRIQSLDLLPEDQEANPTQQQYSPNKKNQKQQAGLQRASPIVSKLPPPTLIQLEDYEDFPDSISELTMKSSHGCAIASQKIHYKDRRMAYYAIGQQQHEDDKQQQDEEHNRWCYFSGLPLKQNESFYAGIIEQGMRTLVVFCLPQAISEQRIQHHYLLQQKEQLNTTTNTNDTKSSLSSVSVSVSATSIHSSTSTTKNNKSKVYPVQKTKSSKSSILSRKKKKNNNNNSSSTQSQSPPSPTKPNTQDLDIIDKIKLLYPDQFSTLPPLIRSQDAWKLFSKFCFFSGIPIADGELHYSLKNKNDNDIDTNNDIYGNNILLSHEVMEAVNGEESAQILRLPNQKLFVYLKKNYNTQCEKIPSDVLFHRKNWQIILPEI